MSEALSHATPFADAAQAYWESGWRGIVPVQGKYPPVTGYTGADGLWPSYPDVIAWSEDHSSWNIALRLPDGILGVDIDAYDSKRGAQTLDECEQRWGKLPDTWRSTSRSDPISGIRLFRVPSGLRWPGQLPGGGVETVLWYHRYCMVWPSRHPEGRVYRWTNNGLTSIGIPSLDELPELPAAWVQGLSRGEWHDEGKISSLDLDALGGGGDWLLSLNRSTAQPCRRVRVLAARLAASLASAGSRHDTMTAAVLDLVRRGEQGHPGVIAALRVLGDAFVAAVTADKSRSSTVAWGEVTRAIDGAVRLIAAQPRTAAAPLGDPCIVLSDPPFDPSAGQAERINIASDSPSARTTSVASDLGSDSDSVDSPATGQNFFPRDEIHPDVIARMRYHAVDREARRRLDEIEHPLVEPYVMQPASVMLSRVREPCLYRVDQLWPIGARVLLAAQMKSGKTTLVGNLLRSLLDGVPFLGYDVTPTDGHVALIDTEMDEAMLVRWLQDVGIASLDRFSIATLRGQLRRFDLRDERILQHWIKHLRELGTSVLIVDCLKPILDQLGLDESRETGKITTPLTRLMIEAGISELILVHHMGHNGERSRGDSALRGWPEVEWHLVRLADDPEKEAEMDAPRYFKAYGRDVDVSERRLDYDRQTRRLSIGGNTNRKSDMAAQKESEIEAAVLAILVELPGEKKGRMPYQVRERDVHGKDVQIYQVIDRLVARGTIRVQLGGPNDRAHHLYLKGHEGE